MSADNLVQRNAALYRGQGLARQRLVFLRIAEALAYPARPGFTVVEYGAGDPSFLAALPPGPRRVGLDGNAAHASAYIEAGVEFHALDLEAEAWPPDAAALAGVDVAVCSDVFEHLLAPLRLLARIAGQLSPTGVLLAHVPNEFRLNRTLAIMLGRRTACGHHSCDEWNDLHLRRSTDRGFRAFLAQRFTHAVRLTHHMDPPRTRLLRRLGLPIPYCLERGPTYAATNDKGTAELLTEWNAIEGNGKS